MKNLSQKIDAYTFLLDLNTKQTHNKCAPEKRHNFFWKKHYFFVTLPRKGIFQQFR